MNSSLNTPTSPSALDGRVYAEWYDCTHSCKYVIILHKSSKGTHHDVLSDVFVGICRPQSVSRKVFSALEFPVEGVTDTIQEKKIEKKLR